MNLYSHPDYSRYLTYEELIESCRSKGVGEELKLGLSKEKRVIFGFKIGYGTKRALIYGEPHAEEVVGTLTVDYLLNEFQHHSDILSQWEFILIPTIDPDGLERNKIWIKQSFDPELFILTHYHRPDEEDIDWCFPISTRFYRFNKPPKETKILIKLIKNFKPHFYSSLHCIHFSGIHFYATENKESLFDEIERFVSNETEIPIQKGVPFFAEKDWAYRDGFYKVIGTIDQIELIQDKISLKDLRRGECGPIYYKSHIPNGFAFIPEVPMLYSPKLNITEETDKTLVKTRIRGSYILLETVELIQDYWNNYKSKFNKRHYQYPKIKEIATTWKDEIISEIRDLHSHNDNVKALFNEVYSNEIIVKYNNSLILGQLYQLIENSSQLSHCEKEAMKEEIIAQIHSIIEETTTKGEIKISNIDDLVKIQAYSILTATDILSQ